MFFTIFRYELRYWGRQPSVYVYAAIFLFVSAGSMAAQAGIFGERAAAPGLVPLANSPVLIHEMAAFFQKMILFLVPAIIGFSIYRDYKSNMHTVLYAYPFTKSSYLPAKFLSAFLVLAGIVSAIGFGFFIGARLPWADPALVGPFIPAAYLQTYLMHILPNIFLAGAIVFAVVALTRNIYAGFIAIVLLLFMQGLAGSLLAGADSRFMAAMLDPFGQAAVAYYTRYWTFAERDALVLPVKGVVVYNRLLWLGIAAAILGILYKSFAFHHCARPFGAAGGKSERSLKNNFGSIARVNLPAVSYGFSFRQQLQACWRLSGIEFMYILKSWPFISILAGGMLVVFFQQAEMNPQYGFKTLPLTWRMLGIPTFMFLGVVHILTFLYAGLLVHRAKVARADQLVDSTPVPNWVFLWSKFMALLKMQALLLSLVMIGGVAVQLLNGYYKFEIGLYVFQLFGLYLPGLAIWAFAALFVQSLFTNPYLGLFLLIMASLGVASLPEFGIEHYVFRYNMGPEFTYSALDGFGATLPPWLLFKAYWMLGGLFLMMGALLLWIRGLPFSFPERLAIAKARYKGSTAFFTLFFLISFLALGSGIYYESRYLYRKINSAEGEELWKVENEKKYKKYEHAVQPRIAAVRLDVDLFPETLDFRAFGQYTLVNRSTRTIDTLLANYSYDEETDYCFDRAARLVSRDTFIRFDIHVLEQGLAPGDSMKMYFETWNEPNSLFRANSPVKYNGTYFTNDIFPGLGYRPIELADKGKRAKYGLPPGKSERPHPSDSTALRNSYSSRHADWITFEATVSTSEDQIAIAPGYLQQEWLDNGRRYFHYKMDSKIKDYYGFNSGRFEVKRDKWQNVDLEIYCHQGHGHNIGSMMKGLKGALAYNTRYFSPYQHRQARIIEFPATVGRFATTFANSIPFSEVQFIIDTSNTGGQGIDFPFYVAAHEMSHQWWGNQLMPADVLGARMLTESMAEYSALKVLEQEYGKARMRRFLKMSLDLYLQGRGSESDKERPLMYAEHGQDYINYRKGALVLYALSDYIGEAKLNGAIKAYLEKVRFQEAPYTTSIEMLEYIRKLAPDSLSYLIEDMFETITLYDNYIREARAKPLSDGRYQVDIGFVAGKYRSGGRGERFFKAENGGSLSFQTDQMKAPVLSLPLEDYIEVGIFGEETVNGRKQEVVLYLQKHKITRIHNRLTIIVGKKPAEVGIDPYNKLIDANSGDNRRGI